jgi:TonB family protein
MGLGERRPEQRGVESRWTRGVVLSFTPQSVQRMRRIQQLAFLLYTTSLSAQVGSETPPPATSGTIGTEEAVFTIVEEMPQFPGGEHAMYMLLVQHIQYPEAAMVDSAQGVCYVSFVVGRDSVLRDAWVLRAPHPALAEEALRVLSTMPAWTPGKQRGQAVNVRMTLPVRFTLRYEEPPAPLPDTAYSVVENMPEFPGGEAALRAYLKESIQYPEALIKKGVGGTVFVTYEVFKDGSIRDAKVLRGVHPLIDAEAIRVINAMPLWKPGEQRGKPVRVQFTLPIRFSTR